jgi:hypothetical protein
MGQICGRGKSRRQTAEDPALAEQYVVAREQKDADYAAELWCFGPKAWNPHFGAPDPSVIRTRAQAIPLKQAMEGSLISTDPEPKIEAPQLFDSGVSMINVDARDRPINCS